MAAQRIKTEETKYISNVIVLQKDVHSFWFVAAALVTAAIIGVSRRYISLQNAFDCRKHQILLSQLIQPS